MSRRAGLLAFALAASSVSVAGAGPTTDEPGPGEPGSMVPSGIDRGYVRPPPGTPVPVAHGLSKIIFVNPCRGGCTFTKSTPGSSDAFGNQTWLGDAPVGSSISISEFAHSQQVWDETIACIREVYSPYGVEVVDVDPGPIPHHEAVLAGRASELPIGGALGVAPLGGGQCEPANNVISFSFANNHGPSATMTVAQRMCWTVAQESAHSYGLDHEFDCSDPLTYIDGCGQKFFRNKAIRCGRGRVEECICGGATQNSHARLTAALGVGTLPPPPTLTVSAPINNSTVQPGFSVIATAIDRRGVARVEVSINGWRWSVVEGVFGKTTPYLVAIPAGVPDGIMELDVRACNDLDVCATQRVTVTRGLPCASAEACAVGQRCDAGRCFWDPPTGVIGDACTYAQACVSEVCADIGSGDLACTENCFGGPNDQCPVGFECSGATGQQGVCAPPPEPGGCCAVTGAGGSGDGAGTTAVAVNLGLGALIGLVAIRRRRRRG